MDGELDLVTDGVRLKGQYRIDARVAKMEQVRVAAGTFSTVKIQSSISIVLTYNKAGHKISLSMSGTDSLWLAKGIGKVREILTSHTETNINGRRKVEDGICKDALRSYTSPTTP